MVFLERVSRCWKESNTEGRMSDIRGKPSQEDFLKIKKDAERIAEQIK
jgi:hypothetical protein